MKIFEFLWIIVCMVKICSAGLDSFSCSKEHFGRKSCSTDKNAYARPFPVVIGTILYLRAINEIDEDKNTLSLQVELLCFWKDPGMFTTSNFSEG